MTILITGGSGMLGGALKKNLQNKGYAVAAVSSKDYDLRDQSAVRNMFIDIQPDTVFHCAALVGGIWANATMKGKFFYENIMMNTIVFEEARLSKVYRFIAMGSGCMYPARPIVPTPEYTLWDGRPEETNAPYAHAKRMLVAQSDAYREQYGFSSAIAVPTNLYGPGDNFHPMDSHLIPALVRKFVEAKQSGSNVTIWGTGNITRDFLHVDDVAEALVGIADNDGIQGPINIGSGIETSLAEITRHLSEITGFTGTIVFDASKPDGEPRKCLDNTKLRDLVGFIPKISLRDGLEQTTRWFIENQNDFRSEER